MEIILTDILSTKLRIMYPQFSNSYTNSTDATIPARVADSAPANVYHVLVTLAVMKYTLIV